MEEKTQIENCLGVGDVKTKFSQGRVTNFDSVPLFVDYKFVQTTVRGITDIYVQSDELKGQFAKHSVLGKT